MAEVVKFYNEGGWGMHLVSACLLASIGITIERIKVLYMDANENKTALLKGINENIMRGDVQGAIRFVSSQKDGPLARILKAGLMKANRPDKEIQAALDQASLSEVPMIEKNTGFLAVLSNAATLAALLGTIAGLIKTFKSVSGDVPAAEKAKLLSEGISEAMHCTAYGLGTAVPVLVAYAIMQSKTQHILEAINESVVAEINFVLESRAVKGGSSAA
jgi:biopolymer transport protein ExbB/TolQ